MKERSSCAKKLLDVVVNFVFVVAHGTIVFKTWLPPADRHITDVSWRRHTIPLVCFSSHRSFNSSVPSVTQSWKRTPAVVGVAETVVPRSSRTAHQITHAVGTRPLVSRVTAVGDLRVPTRVGWVGSCVSRDVHRVAPVRYTRTQNQPINYAFSN